MAILKMQSQGMLASSLEKSDEKVTNGNQVLSKGWKSRNWQQSEED